MHNVRVEIDEQDQIGVGILQHFMTTFDFPRSRLRLTRRTGDFTKNCRCPFAGLDLHFSSSTELVVSTLLDGFPAKAAGVECGDRVLKMNRKLPSSLSRHEINGILADTTEPISLEIQRQGELVKIEFQPKFPANFQPDWKPDPPTFDPGE